MPAVAQTQKAQAEEVSQGELMATALKKIERLTGYRIIFVPSGIENIYDSLSYGGKV